MFDFKHSFCFLLINWLSGQLGASLQNLHERNEGTFEQTELNIFQTLTRESIN